MLIVATRDPEYIASKLVAKARAVNFCSHALFIKVNKLLFIVGLDDFHGSIGRIGNIDLQGKKMDKRRIRRGVSMKKDKVKEVKGKVEVNRKVFE